jgi:chain length determinant protein tyrosine kinase EpsG
MDMKEPGVVVNPNVGRNAGKTGDRSIGAVLVDSGRLSIRDAERIIQQQATNGLRFGETAIAMGLLTQADIDFALSRQFEFTYLPEDDESFSPELAVAFKPFSPVVEQIRVLRSQLMMRWFDDQDRPGALAVISPERREGRSFVAANLAIAFAQLGERTLLIDADMRNPHQAKLFKLDDRAPGLSAVLSGRSGIDAAVRFPQLGGLCVLPAGVVPPNPQDLLARASFEQLIAHAAKLFQVVIVDTPAASASADAMVVAARAGAALMVARRDYTPASALQSAVTALNKSNARIVGSVLNAF